MKNKRGLNKHYGQKHLRAFCVLRSFFFLCIFCIVSIVNANDFGIIIDQTVSYGGIEENSIEYSGKIIPRYQALLGDRGELYISAGFECEYIYENWRFIPELLRTELSFQFDKADLTAGRMYYSDPLGFIASGLFDGARLTILSDFGSFSVGAWYTGFLYKERINIVMTQDDLASFITELDFNNFYSTYFAPKRLIAAFDFEHLDLDSLQSRLAAIAQFDLTGNLNSQYIAIKLTKAVGLVSIDMGACAEFILDGKEFGFAWAGVFGIQAFLGKSGLLFSGRFSGANFNDSPVSAFLPITTIAMGEILDAKLSGISCITAEYSYMLSRTLTASAGSTYFILSDNETFLGYPVTEDNTGYFLGPEFSARIIWSPFSDLNINLKGGVFLPSLGNAAPDAGIKWRIELNVIFGL